jgi:nitrite reductase/ring-hydroxylating ferredoxin subunit
VDLLETNYVKVAIKSEIPVGKMKHIEVNEKEIMIANVEGEFYAISDRCGHENARLSMGTLTNTIVTCPMHFATFDVTTGKAISGPKLESSGAAKMLAKCPEDTQKAMTQTFQRIGEIQSSIKTYNLPVYKVKVDGNDLLVQL